MAVLTTMLWTQKSRFLPSDWDAELHGQKKTHRCFLRCHRVRISAFPFSAWPIHSTSFSQLLFKLKAHIDHDVCREWCQSVTVWILRCYDMAWVMTRSQLPNKLTQCC